MIAAVAAVSCEACCCDEKVFYHRPAVPHTFLFSGSTRRFVFVFVFVFVVVFVVVFVFGCLLDLGSLVSSLRFVSFRFVPRRLLAIGSLFHCNIILIG